MLQIPRIVIAGLSSGVGKTTVMVALTIALKRRGFNVCTYKCGPDYLDPTYHKRSSEITCHNLDGWIMGQDAVRETFIRSASGADIALIEGVMGLFDGANPKGSSGSTAEIARWLDAPVLVTIDASGMARTIGAIELGLKEFDKELNITGLITNFVGSVNHKTLLEEALSILPILGGFDKRPSLKFPDRHLGLTTAREDTIPQELLEQWADLAEQWFDIDGIIEIARSANPIEPIGSERKAKKSNCTIAYAYDEAFHFYYEDNLNRLRSLGAELVPFSPINDSSLPKADGLYLGGGYPELFAEKLSLNRKMIFAIREFASCGKPIYGECGGLIYLCESLMTTSGEQFTMTGLLPGKITMADKLQALGYVEVEIQKPSFLGEAGTRFRGHQFRYSNADMDANTTTSYSLRKRRNNQVSLEGYSRHNNVIGSYVHAHWASNPRVCENFVRSCERLKS